MNNPAIRFNGQIEYSFNGDIAQLGASLGILEPEQVANERLSLQLWACEDNFDPAAPQGTRVADLPLQPQLSDGFYRDQTFALPPAGNRDYLMALALVGESAEGSSRVHDFALFENRQLFTQPRIEGRVDCQLLNDSVELYVESVTNPRDAENRSGSLQLELWALNAPYTGGAFTGFPLASSELGNLDGNCEWRDCNFNLALNQPPVGEWTVVLMLREWTSTGYVTRDFRQLPDLVREPQQAAPVTTEVEATPDFIPAEAAAKNDDEKEVEAKPATAEKAPAKEADSAATKEADSAATNADSAATKEAKPVEAEVKAEKAVKAEQPAAKVEVEAKEKVEAEEKAEAKSPAEKPAEKAAAKPAVKVEAKTSAAKPAAQPAKTAKAQKEPAEKAPVSINKAEVEELIGVKGLSPRLAKAIVSDRPYKSIDDLQKVRGLGAKLIAKLREQLCL
ncbi:helix-hairpin-helix domain-containing protein [Marinobacterium sp. YM272]|uniref:ComEA family DNA-binding protein n=1 Tax=Marinobacterium sp. YM272 TaxID=3421654 RepID=UPI003D7F6FC0